MCLSMNISHNDCPFPWAVMGKFVVYRLWGAMPIGGYKLWLKHENRCRGLFLPSEEILDQTASKLCLVPSRGPKQLFSHLRSYSCNNISLHHLIQFLSDQELKVFFSYICCSPYKYTLSIPVEVSKGLKSCHPCLCYHECICCLSVCRNSLRSDF